MPGPRVKATSRLIAAVGQARLDLANDESDTEKPGEKGFFMFTSQQDLGDVRRPQGCGSAGIAELRRGLATPSRMTDGDRQRLLDLARRVARVQSLGGGYSRVSLSEHAQAAIGRRAAC